jgi:hypothetical protein
MVNGLAFYCPVYHFCDCSGLASDPDGPALDGGQEDDPAISEAPTFAEGSKLSEVASLGGLFRFKPNRPFRVFRALAP